MTTNDNARQCTMTMLVNARWRRIGLQWCHTTTNDNRWQWRWLLSAAGSYYCKSRFANWGLLILSTYNFFNLNNMQSTAISIMWHGACHKAWHPNARRPKAPN